MLVVGDIHYPDRAKAFPDFLPKGNDMVAGTGDYTSYQALLEVASYGKGFVGVRGNSDWNLKLPERTVFFYKGISFGLYHGHNIRPRGNVEALTSICEEMGCEVLLTGHTHKLGVVEHKGTVIVNPGSATGAWGGSTAGEPKTAVLIEVDEVLRITSIGEVRREWVVQL